MKLLKLHPAAEVLPRMSEKEFRELTLSIKEHGLKEPITMHEGKILDGRHRHEACISTGQEPKYVDWDGSEGSPIEFVFIKNFARRNMTESQKAAAATEALKLMEADGKKRSLANLKKGKEMAPDAATGQHRGRSTERLAERLGIGARTLERAKSVASKVSIEEFKAIRDGEKTLGKVEKSIRRTEQLAEIKAYVPPKGLFQVITIDPSWKYRDTLDGSDAVRGAPPYPPQTVEEVVDFIKTTLAPRCDLTCLLGCWVTNPIVLDLKTWPVVQEAIESIGFRPVKLETWRKIEKSGLPFTGLGNGVRNDTEQLVLFARGHVLYNEMGEQHGRELQRTFFEAPIGEHSEKPDLAYARLEQLVPYTKRLEMFARAPRAGWTGSGSELSAAQIAAAFPAGKIETKRRLLPLERTVGTEVAEALHRAGITGEREPMFIETPAGQAVVKAINEGEAKYSAEVLNLKPKKDRKIHLANDCTAPNCPLCRGAA